MDEAGMDDTERYAYGHSAKGKRCYAEKPGKKSIRINFIGGLRGKQFMAPMMVEGYCNANVCQAYIGIFCTSNDAKSPSKTRRSPGVRL
ncbi:transposase [Piscirickettsia salmonis]|uniref:transposase n=1 Tax=Piscirickettsia salmonis TaxID=1238 RepID=UPI00166281A0|nr:transposase [Piscirickettsia salmonis]QNR81292.1 transposase [Piscirickettsia salmonis]